jgi:hypothetical protein
MMRPRGSTRHLTNDARIILLTHVTLSCDRHGNGFSDRRNVNGLKSVSAMKPSGDPAKFATGCLDLQQEEQR